ncbi:RAD55 family ATPase [Halapricum hydrolyticum]|uniref:HTR-like protein n=1 Tax=Halapricum hydrolyticum TaxID=2979991 RepID=A0AAE3IGY7_9EURY|nr:HTR-like protein [Halapricum hydrolyticum]MCU4719521.1 HTR-like protein [Halapricum hydrolyticum]MCU4728195.1 HTR-like protein [Halapricum hydrolyticum]
MVRIPFGIRQLDTTIGGGAPPGSVVLLSGEAGAGAREFMHTSPLITGLAKTDPELFDLYYGDLPSAAELPEEIHYVSLTASERQFREEASRAFEAELFETGMEAIEYHDLSTTYFHVSPIPRKWYAERAPSIKDIRTRDDREELLTVLGDLLSEHATGNLVVIDSLTDLISAIGDRADLEWADVAFFMKGLQKAAHEWGGLILTYLNFETISGTRQGQLVDATDGTLTFEWASGGSTLARTMVVQQFRGVLSQLESENIVRFETEFTDAGFDISDVRKIR